MSNIEKMLSKSSKRIPAVLIDLLSISKKRSLVTPWPGSTFVLLPTPIKFCSNSFKSSSDGYSSNECRRFRSSAAPMIPSAPSLPPSLAIDLKALENPSVKGSKGSISNAAASDRSDWSSLPGLLSVLSKGPKLSTLVVLAVSWVGSGRRLEVRLGRLSLLMRKLGETKLGVRLVVLDSRSRRKLGERRLAVRVKFVSPPTFGVRFVRLSPRKLGIWARLATRMGRLSPPRFGVRLVCLSSRKLGMS
mmetsp:Transcript_4134/g.7033  ORF Transcript_4134/g.7033 Transcript_4134/m.7033 type:complete len:247 (-) Transcript_4134:684-1424(-)